MALRVAAEVEADEIWSYVATESGDADVAERLITSITDHFFMLSKHPQLGRRRERDVLILHVLHGRRDLKTLLNQ
jgi:plasmid stabilization system protein ParE